MVQRIRDVLVADEIAAQAGTDATPELVLGEVLTPVIFAPQRPPLAASGYFPGTAGLNAAAVALNTSHVGLFGSGFAASIVRVNNLWIQNTTSGGLLYSVRRVDSPFVGFPSVQLVPAYINAGNPTTGGVFSITKTDTIAAVGVFMFQVFVEGNQTQHIIGPWVLNDGILLINCNTVNTNVRAIFGYERWPAIRKQPPG